MLAKNLLGNAHQFSFTEEHRFKKLFLSCRVLSFLSTTTTAQGRRKQGKGLPT